MRIICLKDKKIEEDELKKVYNDVFQFYRDAGIEPELTIKERDFSDLPFEDYWQDALGIKKSYISDQAKAIKKTHGKRFDLIDFMVHEDNWEPMEDGIWGWNLADAKSGFEIEQTRWDKANMVNSVGTLYHEIMHSHDSFAYRYMKVWLEKIVNVSDWDDDVVHGQAEKYDYIRHDQNQDALKEVSDTLKESFAKREEQYRKSIEELTSLRDKLRTLVDLYRRLAVYAKKQDKPITSNHIESWTESRQ